MKDQSLLITLCITTLTACAVDKNDDAQVIIDKETRLRTDEVIRETNGRRSEEEYVILQTPMPSEQKFKDERGKPDWYSSSN